MEEEKQKQETGNEQTKIEEKTEKKKVAEQPKIEIKEKKEEKSRTGEKPKKTSAVVNGKDLPISTKHAVAICNFIRGKKVEEAIFLLEEVLRMKRAIPMRGELPHRKGKMMSGRYPIKASQEFVKLLKQLSANATVNDLDLEKGKIECKADKASQPYKRFGNMRFKRTHVTLKLKIEEEGRKEEDKKE